MASTSNPELNTSRNYRQWLTETFDGHEMLDDELSDSNLDGNGNLINPLDQHFPMTMEHREPYIGMEFESAEDAREFYEIIWAFVTRIMYGRHMGFTIRNNRTRRSLKDNSIIGREFVCSKEGFRAEKYTKKETRVFTSRPATREGCNAMLRIAAKDGGKWVIYGFVKEHNHVLNPSKVPPRRSHRIAFCEVWSISAMYKLVLGLCISVYFCFKQKKIKGEEICYGPGLWIKLQSDEKDLKIRELSTELHREKKKSAAYQEQLQMVLNYIEEHTQRLSLKVNLVSNNLRELEYED
ncbi:protein FAR1-RELATED SEQUENCE 5 [Gossypium hirsutum]|uniref:Protein FAR1-RELATED SEQUENCE 5 n=1 Tax=Gossypium hirsutum TaxID=3635 RepID=A0ABM2YVG1_GOSHI|nr:protein FAR1-RELATED SEQUENCE 5-like [Gossypium hirsutum]